MALSNEKRKLKHFFEMSNSHTPSAEKVQKYLEQVYGVKIPENFASRLTMEHREFHGTPFHMKLSLVDAIVEACECWHNYVVDWDALICNEVLSMVRIHTSVISPYFLMKEGTLLKKEPSFYMKTTVTYDGNVRFFDR